MPRRINRSLQCRLALAIALALLASCARPRQPAPQKTPTPTPPAQTAPASAPSSVAPYGYVYTPPASQNADPNAPQILEIDLNDSLLSAPGPIRVRVLTNPIVNSVVAQAMSRELAVPQEAPGVFGADAELPNVPFFLHARTFKVQIIASTPFGRTASVTIPITLR